MATSQVTVGPELGGTPSLSSVAFDLSSVGYGVHEHVVSGTATSYSAAERFEPDGRWDAVDAASAPFTTRAVVVCPQDAGRGNGTVVCEWLNVTGGLDIAALWMMTHRHLLRDGYTWVGVSAQWVGIEGGGMMPGLGLRQSAPERYEALVHPGDAFAYDMFTQVARAVRDMLPERYGVHAQRMIATGASQSAFHLTTYVNAVDVAQARSTGSCCRGEPAQALPSRVGP